MFAEEKRGGGIRGRKSKNKDKTKQNKKKTEGRRKEKEKCRKNEVDAISMKRVTTIGSSYAKRIVHSPVIRFPEVYPFAFLFRCLAVVDRFTTVLTREKTTVASGKG